MSNCCFFFFNDTATTEIYTVSDTLSLHDALPILRATGAMSTPPLSDDTTFCKPARSEEHTSELQSPDTISYAVFCLKKKKEHALTMWPDRTRSWIAGSSPAMTTELMGGQKTYAAARQLPLFFLMKRPPPRSTLCQTLFPYTTLFRSYRGHVGGAEAPVALDQHSHLTAVRSEEHTSELQSPDTNSYAVFCLKKKKTKEISAQTKTTLLSTLTHVSI